MTSHQVSIFVIFQRKRSHSKQIAAWQRALFPVVVSPPNNKILIIDADALYKAEFAVVVSHVDEGGANVPLSRILTEQGLFADLPCRALPMATGGGNHINRAEVAKVRVGGKPNPGVQLPHKVPGAAVRASLGDPANRKPQTHGCRPRKSRYAGRKRLRPARSRMRNLHNSIQHFLEYAVMQVAHAGSARPGRAQNL